MSNLPAQVEEAISRKKLIRAKESVLVGVSGGLDSMVLLHLLHALSKSHGWKLTVAHLNHRLRGRSSDADERLVQKTAARWKLKFVSERADVKSFAKANRLSIEMAARQLRHEFFARTAKQLGIKSIALAHHADDQVELFFLRLLRGAGSEGLAGMDWKSPSASDPSRRIVRPLLGFSKEALREFAGTKKVPFHEDATNACLDFQRNRIRHEVLPLLKTIQPAVKETVLRTMGIVSAESSYVLQAAENWLKDENGKPFGELPIALQRVCLRLQLHALGFPAHFDLVERLRAASHQVIAVDSMNSVCRDSAGMVFRRAGEAYVFSTDEKQIDLEEKTTIRFGGRTITWSLQKKKGDTLAREENCEWFDAGKIGSRIRLRYWRRGDRFQPIGTSQPKKLQDLFINLKVARAERHNRIVAATERGEIFWVEGLRISERFKLDKQTTRRLKWHWQ